MPALGFEPPLDGKLKLSSFERSPEHHPWFLTKNRMCLWAGVSATVSAQGQSHSLSNATVGLALCLVGPGLSSTTLQFTAALV